MELRLAILARFLLLSSLALILLQTDGRGDSRQAVRQWFPVQLLLLLARIKAQKKLKIMLIYYSGLGVEEKELGSGLIKLR